VQNARCALGVTVVLEPDPNRRQQLSCMGRVIARNGTEYFSRQRIITYYLLLLCYPITIGAVVVFMGSWVSSLSRHFTGLEHVLADDNNR
jgi:hypothetical protein